MNKKQIEKAYKKLLNDVATKEYYATDLTHRVNCYTCDSCGHITKTKDVASGVTPAFFNCEACKAMAHSSFYTDIAPDQKPTIAWYRPTLAATLKLSSKYGLRDHVLKGGLLARPITE